MIYLDNSATTAVCEKAREYADYAFKTAWHNPSSLYRAGMEAEALVSRTRARVAECLHCQDNEIFFTGCGTESNNTALFGAAEALKKRGNRIVTTAIEHPSVARAADELQKRGFDVVRLTPQKDGKVAVDDIEKAVNKDTVLVSIMLVNNETGAVQPVDKVKEIIKKSDSPALFHCDAVQAFGKMNIDVKALGIDLLSASGHKLHAPKGVGVLYKRNGVNIPPLLFGGGQEHGFRSGTEAVPAIYALCGAIEQLEKPDSALPKMKKLFGYALKRLLSLDGVVLNSPEDALPYIINVSVTGYRSETLLHFLEADGICVSSGSACSKGAKSGVLTAMGLSNERADSALRISFCQENEKEDIDALCESIEKAQKRLKKSSKM